MQIHVRDETVARKVYRRNIASIISPSKISPSKISAVNNIASNLSRLSTHIHTRLLFNLSVSLMSDTVGAICADIKSNEYVGVLVDHISRCVNLI